MEAFGGRWPRWRQLTSTAAHRGVLCFGPDRDRKVTYTNPGHWLPGFRPADSGAALRMLITRYLYAYGPATPRHFAQWLGISPRQAAGLFGKLAGELEGVELDGEPGWALRAQAHHHRRTAARADRAATPAARHEANLVGAVMEASATLTVGPVTVGPHA